MGFRLVVRVLASSHLRRSQASGAIPGTSSEPSFCPMPRQSTRTSDPRASLIALLTATARQRPRVTRDKCRAQARACESGAPIGTLRTGLVRANS